MPELPEVETTRRGIEPHLLDRKIKRVIVRNRQLRWPVSPKLAKAATGSRVHSVRRRAKYLLIGTDTGTIIIHLGMSGSLRILPSSTPAEKHDHFDLVIENNLVLRLRDPRRFGAVLWTGKDPLKHKRLVGLGPEPLTDQFNTDTIHKQASGRVLPVKTFIMTAKIVVGVGNIYASEALFRAGIHPETATGKISTQRLDRLVMAIKSVLSQAIEQGGTTLKDFTGSDGKPGYFSQSLNVYGREGKNCYQCNGVIRRLVIGQRSTFYCPRCQR